MQLYPLLRLLPHRGNNLIVQTDFCIRQLLPNKLKDRYCFKTEEAIKCLKYPDVMEGKCGNLIWKIKLNMELNTSS